MVTQAPFERVERDSLRLAAVLILAGVVVTAIAGFLHPEGADANDHRTIFRYLCGEPVMDGRASRSVHRNGDHHLWICGPVLALDVRTGVELWLNRLALLSAGAGMALYGVLQAVMRRCGRSPWAGDASAGCPTAKSILLGDT
jgi:hypothetical protein